MAMNIISKEKKEIKWIGLPTNSVQECQHIEVSIFQYFSNRDNWKSANTLRYEHFNISVTGIIGRVPAHWGMHIYCYISVTWVVRRVLAHQGMEISEISVTCQQTEVWEFNTMDNQMNANRWSSFLVCDIVYLEQETGIRESSCVRAMISRTWGALERFPW